MQPTINERKYHTECNKCFGTGCICDSVGHVCICDGCDCYKLHKMGYNNSVYENCKHHKKEEHIPLERFFENFIHHTQRLLNRISRGF